MAGFVSPWWIGYFMACPLRKLVQDPEKILAPQVPPGATALDAGCAMGFFSLAMAELVGPGGRVHSVDLQKRMIDSLRWRAARAGLSERIDARTCAGNDLGIDDLAGKVDFALSFCVLQEVPDPASFLRQIHRSLKPEGKLLVAAPTGRVGREAYKATLATIREAGFELLERPKIPLCRTALCAKS